MACYIFGYGSLINSASRRITGIAGASLAVRVQDLERTWVSWEGFNMRAVAARPMLGASTNGVLFEVPELEIESSAYREHECCAESKPPCRPIQISAWEVALQAAHEQFQ